MENNFANDKKIILIVIIISNGEKNDSTNGSYIYKGVNTHANNQAKGKEVYIVYVLAL